MRTYIHIHVCTWKQFVLCTVKEFVFACTRIRSCCCRFYRSILIDCFYEAFAGKSGELIYCALPLTADTTNTDAIENDYTHTHTHIV